MNMQDGRLFEELAAMDSGLLALLEGLPPASDLDVEIPRLSESGLESHGLRFLDFDQFGIEMENAGGDRAHGPDQPTPFSTSTEPSDDDSVAPIKHEMDSSTGPDTLPRRGAKINTSRERMKRELVELRRLVHELEERLVVVKQERRVLTEIEVNHQTQRLLATAEQEAIVSAVTAFWERNAKREREARQLAMAENARLRRMVGEYVRAAEILRALLEEKTHHKRLTDEERLCRSLDRLHFTEEERAMIDFSLMKNFDTMYSQLDTILVRSGLARKYVTFQDLTVRPSTGGHEPTYEFVDARILPFDPETTDAISWRTLQSPMIATDDGLYAAEECIGDLVRAKFAINMKIHNTDVFGRGRVVARRHIEANRCVIISAAWMSAEGGILGERKVEVVDEGWSVLERLPGTEYSISKDCFLTRCNLSLPMATHPRGGVDDELRGLVNLVHRAYCQAWVNNYEHWERMLMREAKQLGGLH